MTLGVQPGDVGRVLALMLITILLVIGWFYVRAQPGPVAPPGATVTATVTATVQLIVLTSEPTLIPAATLTETPLPPPTPTQTRAPTATLAPIMTETPAPATPTMFVQRG